MVLHGHDIFIARCEWGIYIVYWLVIYYWLHRQVFTIYDRKTVLRSASKRLA